MEHWNAFVDYFMDFEKVRKFQELCGLKEEEEYNKDVEQLIKDMGKEQQLCKNGKMCTKNNQDDGSDSFKVQKKTYKVTNPLLHYMFLFGSMMGTEIFYITFTPILFWTIDIFIARKVVTVWVVTMLVFHVFVQIRLLNFSELLFWIFLFVKVSWASCKRYSALAKAYFPSSIQTRA